MHECAHYVNTRRKTRHSQQRVVEAAGHAHAEAEEQVSKVVEVPGRRVSQPKSGVDFKISNLAQPQKPQTRRREECSVPSPAVYLQRWVREVR